MTETTETQKPADVVGRLDGLVICPSCNATMPFNFNCMTCQGAGVIEKAVALMLERTKPFQKIKTVIEGNPTNGDRLRDLWADNAELTGAL